MICLIENTAVVQSAMHLLHLRWQAPESSIPRATLSNDLVDGGQFK